MVAVILGIIVLLGGLASLGYLKGARERTGRARPAARRAAPARPGRPTGGWNRIVLSCGSLPSTFRRPIPPATTELRS
jgi:hypothetical protein